MKRVTVKMLKSLGACAPELATFAKEWPDGAAVTKSNVLRAAELKLNLDWVAEKLLSPPALAEYDRVKATAWAEYDRVTAPALAECDRVKATGLWKLLRKEKAK